MLYVFLENGKGLPKIRKIHQMKLELLFLLCFYGASMNIGRKLNVLNDDHKTIFRGYEKTLQKISQAECSSVFNETCINEGLLPKYTNTIIT